MLLRVVRLRKLQNHLGRVECAPHDRFAEPERHRVRVQVKIKLREFRRRDVDSVLSCFFQRCRRFYNCLVRIVLNTACVNFNVRCIIGPNKTRLRPKAGKIVRMNREDNSRCRVFRVRLACNLGELHVNLVTVWPGEQSILGWLNGVDVHRLGERKLEGHWWFLGRHERLEAEQSWLVGISTANVHLFAGSSCNGVNLIQLHVLDGVGSKRNPAVALLGAKVLVCLDGIQVPWIQSESKHFVCRRFLSVPSNAHDSLPGWVGRVARWLEHYLFRQECSKLDGFREPQLNFTIVHVQIKRYQRRFLVVFLEVFCSNLLCQRTAWVGIHVLNAGGLKRYVRVGVVVRGDSVVGFDLVQVGCTNINGNGKPV